MRTTSQQLAPITVGTVTTLTAGSPATVTNSGTVLAPKLDFGVPQGPAGSSASATPLATTTPANLGTAAVGTSSSAARADHVHSLPAGLLNQLYTGTVGETLVVGLSLGVRRYTVTVPGVTTTDRLMIALTGIPSNGTIQDVYPTAANTVSVGLLVPALGIGTVISVPIVIYKVV